MDYRKIVVAGGGVLGSQIAFQAAYCGFDVTIWLRSEDSMGRTTPKLTKLYETYCNTIEAMATDDGKLAENWARGISEHESFSKSVCMSRAQDAYQNIKMTINMESAVDDADLVIESLAENLDDKISFYKKMAPLLPEKTVIVTNSSTLLPSKMAAYTKRPNKFLSMHFANSIWKNNIVEIMGHETTEKKYFDEIIEFAESIKMIPLPVTKEKSGYLLNSMLVPFLLSALDLYANGISDPESIDKAWTLGTGAPKGPFRIMDTVGLLTVKKD